MTAQGDLRRFRRFLAAVIAMHLVLSVIAVGLGARLGPLAVRLAYGNEYAVASTDFALLVAAAACFFGAQLVTQALMALGCGRSVAAGYALGGATMAAVLVATDGLVRRVEVAFLAGTSATYAACAVLVGYQLARRRSPTNATSQTSAGSGGVIVSMAR